MQFQRLKTFLALSVLLLGGALISDSLAQTYTVKKDVILKDQVPYAKISGKAGLGGPANLFVSALNGDSLFTMKAWGFPSVNPVYDEYAGLAVYFVASRKTLIKSGNVYAGKEKVLDFLLKDFTGNLIVDNKVDPVAEQDLIKAFDNQANLQKIIDGEKAGREFLKTRYKPKGDASKKVSQTVMSEVKHEQKGKMIAGITKKIKIYQDGQLLGILTKETSSIMSYYTISILPDEPILVGTDSVTEVIVATAIAYNSIRNYGKLLVNLEDYKEQDLNIADPYQGELDVINFLIKNKFL